MKKVIGFIVALVVAVALFFPCRSYAIEERGSKAIGGEALVPVLVLIVYAWWSDACKENA